VYWCNTRVDSSQDTLRFLHSSLDYAIQYSDDDDACCAILVEAGVQPNITSLYTAIKHGNEPVCRLFVQHGVDPFQQEEDDGTDDGSYCEPVQSPLPAAARRQNTSLLEDFLDVWHERFASTQRQGKNSDGDYPIHVICSDAHVSLDAIQVLVRCQSETVAMVDGREGLLPFHFAANWGASLNVIYYLVRHCPDALHHAGKATAATATNVAKSSDPVPSLPGEPDSTRDTGTAAAASMSDIVRQTGQSVSENARVVGPVKKKAKTGTRLE
jgi:hypothetical protein